MFGGYGTASTFLTFSFIDVEVPFGSGKMARTLPKTPHKSPRKRAAPRQAQRFWSAEVTRESNALDLEPGVFSLSDPSQIAASLKRSAEASRRKKTDSFRSALSMLTFYINRAGANLPQARRRTLMRAKDELRKQFGRAPSRRGAPPRAAQRRAGSA